MQHRGLDHLRPVHGRYCWDPSRSTPLAAIIGGRSRSTSWTNARATWRRIVAETFRSTGLGKLSSAPVRRRADQDRVQP